MSDKPEVEIRNKENVILPDPKNADGSPVQEVLHDGKPVAEIRNKENVILPDPKNADGSPIKVFVPT